MADTSRTLAALQALFPDNSAGDISAQDLRDFLVSSYQPQGICRCRLTTESGVPVSTADRTAQSTLYLTPTANGNAVGLYESSSWVLYPTAEVSLSLSGLTSGKNYDAFAYTNAGSLTFDLGPAWSGDSTRGTGAGTTELTSQDGAAVNAVSITSAIRGHTVAAKAGRYVGTIRTTGTTTTEDSEAKRFVWSAYNQAARRLMRYDVGTAHSYGTGSWREWNGGSGGPHRLYLVTGEVQAFESSGWVEMKGDASNASYTTLSLNDAAAEGMAVASTAVNTYGRIALAGGYVAAVGFNELVVTQISFGGGNYNYYRAMARILG